MGLRRFDPEPLFRPLASKPVPEGEARCNRCHLVRPMTMVRCPCCGNYEYSLAPAPRTRRRPPEG